MRKEIDLRTVANPYDFANPVSEDSLFFGRDEEQIDVIYYIRQMQETRKAIHVAFIGERAAGKTSFLNISEIEARKRNFVSVRLDLNESDVRTSLSFFRKFFCSIAEQAFAAGAFNGKAGRTYAAYLDLVSTYTTDSPPEFQPFTFLSICSRALAAGRDQLVVPDEHIKADLDQIYKEVGRPFIILVDECNVFKSNRVILEQIRNIFMNQRGFMLMFAGTKDFFPLIDEIFSPISRQFKKIEIGPFREPRHAADCVLKPLYQIGMQRPEVRRLVPRSMVREIFLLSGGRPYEIQLICHYLFKQCQLGRARRFGLDIATLESMQRELAADANIEARPVIRAARRLQRQELLALSVICFSDEDVSFNDAGDLEYIIHGRERFSSGDLLRHFDTLARAGVIEDTKNVVEFKGDNIDRLYVKYIARQKGADTTFGPISFTDAIERGIEGELYQFHEFIIRSITNRSDNHENLDDLIRVFQDGILPDRYENMPIAAQIMMTESLIEEDVGERIICSLQIKSHLGKIQMFFLWRDVAQISSFQKFTNRIFAVIERANEVGWDASFDQRKIQMPSKPNLLAIIGNHSNDMVREQISYSILLQMPETYVDEQDRARAKAMVETAFAINASRQITSANNVGYLYLADGNLPEAKLWLEAGLQWGDDDELALKNYNMAILEYSSGNLGRSLSFLRAASSALREGEDAASVLLRLRRDSAGVIAVYEDFGRPRLKDAILDALKIIEGLAPSPDPLS